MNSTKQFSVKSILAVLLVSSCWSVFGQSKLNKPTNALFEGIKIQQSFSELGGIFKESEVFHIPSQKLTEYVRSNEFDHTLHLRLGDSHNWALQLFPNDLRSADYLAWSVTEKGHVIAPKTANTTFIGVSQSNDRVSLSIDDHFIYGFVGENQKEVFIEPLNRFVKDAPKDYFVVYKASMVIPNPHLKCGMSDMRKSKLAEEPNLTPNQTTAACRKLRLAIASDFSMFQKQDNNASAARNYTLGVINNVQSRFFTGVFNFNNSANANIQFEVVENVVFESANLNFTTSTNSRIVLDSFATWANSANGFQRAFGLGEFWTNRIFDGNIAGLARYSNAGTICSQRDKYHVLRDYTVDAAGIQVMTAHEIGHNFGAAHDADNEPGFVMQSAVAPTATSFSTVSLSPINTNVPNLNCLLDCSVLFRPDLTISSLIRSTTVVKVGTSFDLTVKVKNIGSEHALPSKLNIYLSSDAQLSSDDVLLTIKDVNRILTNQTETLVIPITINTTTLSSGYLIAKADASAVLDESDETNNSKSSDETTFYWLTLSTNSLSYTSAQSSKTVSITSNVGAWTVSDDADWVSISPTSGSNNGSIIISCTANTGSARTAAVTVTGGSGTNSITQIIVVTQNAAATSINVSPTALNATATGGIGTVSVTSNVYCTIVSDNPWLTTSISSGSNNFGFNITVANNPLTTIRTGTVRIYNGATSKTITVTQAAAPVILNVSPNALAATATGGIGAIAVSSNVYCTIVSDNPWLTTSVNGGSNNFGFNITVANNLLTTTRTGTVRVYNGATSKTITVTQAAAPVILNVSPNALAATATGGIGAIAVSSNVYCTIVSDNPWLTTSVSGGSNNFGFNITVANNLLTTTRTGTVRVYNGATSKTITVTQAAAPVFLNVSPTALSASTTGGVGAIAVSSNVLCTIVSDNPWLTTSVRSGSNNFGFNITVAQNPLTTIRTGTVRVYNGATSKTITVTQAAAPVFLNVSPTALTASATGGVGSITVSSNLSCTIVSDNPWLTTSVRSGSNSFGFNITVANNLLTTSRTGTVRIYNGATSKTITITQAATPVFLNVSPTALSASATGGVGAIAVSSNVLCTIVSDNPWLTTSVRSGSNNFGFNITVTQNPLTTIRTGTVRIYNGATSKTITVTQAAAPVFLNVSPTAFTATAAGGTGGVVVTSNATCNVISDNSWLTASVNSGSNNFGFSIIVAANTSIVARTGTVRVYSRNVSQTITVLQAGKAITCGVPTGLVASSIAGTTCRLSWNSVLGASYYTLWYWNGSTWVQFGNNVSGTTIAISGLTRNSQYYFAVQAVCNGVGSSLSNYVGVKTTNGLSPDRMADNGENISNRTGVNSLNYATINEIYGNSAGISIELQPNPVLKMAATQIICTSESNQTVQLKICDLSGKELHQRNIDLTTGINVLTITAPAHVGVYIITLHNAVGNTITQKMVVID